MSTILEEMLRQYQTKNLTEKKNALKEIVQEVVLCGLSRAGFFERAAFYGGTALRIFHGLDRFSEDLDFSLVEPDAQFSPVQFFPVLKKEIASFGLNMELSEKKKDVESAIRSAFIKGNTMELFLLCFPNEPLSGGVHRNEAIRIKFEIDTNPPPYANFVHEYRLMPSPYTIRLYDGPSLFAGKIHAILCRTWKNRTKGRDLYDYVFYLSRNIPVNRQHLVARLVQSGFAAKNEAFPLEAIRTALNEKFTEIDYDNARKDVLPFVRDARTMALWSPDFFQKITTRLREKN